MKRALLILFTFLLPAVLTAQTSVIVRGKVSTANATTSVLTNAGVFTGGWEDARDYTTLTVTVFADKDSATDGLECQWGSDASNVDLTDKYTVSANVGASWTTVTKGRYYRLKYTNGSVTQTVFRLSAILRQSGAPAASASGGGLTDSELRATPVPVSGTVTANVGTGTQPVSGTVTANAGSGPWPITDNDGSITVDGTFWQSTQPVSGPVTDAQLRATPVPISGTVTVTDGAGALNVIVDSGTVTTTPPSNATTNVTQVAGTAVDVNSGLKSSGTQRIVIATDQPQLTNALKVDGSGVTQPISGTVTANAGSGTLAVSGPVTDAQLRASAVPVTDNPSLVASANNDGAAVSVTTSSGTVLASFSTRGFAQICSLISNTDAVFLKLGAVATTSDLRLEIGQCFSVGGTRVYTGVIDARSNTGTQSVAVVEW